jgi:hypothetical protein
MDCVARRPRGVARCAQASCGAKGDNLLGRVARMVGDDSCDERGREDSAPTWRTYVAVEDAGELVRRAEEAGGSLLMEPFDMPGVGRLVAFQHPAAGQLLAPEYLQPFA